MADLSNWKLMDDFTALEAVALVTGEDPSKVVASQVIGNPVYQRMEFCYLARKKWLLWDGEDQDEWKKLGVATEAQLLESQDMLRQSCNGGAGLVKWQMSKTQSDFIVQRFCRKELSRWLKANNVESRYQFDRVEVTKAGAKGTVWPWGSHHTELLGVLEAAANQFWVGYDPKHPKTAPKNETVIAWLLERGISASMANAIATMLRHNDLKSGPRS